MKLLRILSIAGGFLCLRISFVFSEATTEGADAYKTLNETTMKAKVTLVAFKANKLTPKEEEFFDKTFIVAYGKVHHNEDYVVDAVSVQEESRHTSTNDKHLRALTQYWNDIFVWIDWNCRLCPGDDDWYYGRNLLRTHLNKNQMKRKHRKFERVFCKMLRSGPFENFKQVHDCNVTFLED
jgi:hypothetical protein